MMCVIRDSKPSFQRRIITIWVFTYYMDSLHHYKYKWNSSHSKWTRYTAIISSSIYLGQIQTAVTRTSRHSLLSKNHLIKTPPKTKSPDWRVQPLLMSIEFIFSLIWMLGVTISIDKMTMRFKGHHVDKKMMMYKSEGGVL